MNIELKDVSHNPIYAQVREQLEFQAQRAFLALAASGHGTQIRNKQISSGDPLPSPAALAQKLSVDKGEIQRAYFELEQAGLVEKSTGKDFLGKPKTTYTVA